MEEAASAFRRYFIYTSTLRGMQHVPDRSSPVALIVTDLQGRGDLDVFVSCHGAQLREMFEQPVEIPDSAGGPPRSFPPFTPEAIEHWRTSFGHGFTIDEG